MWHALRNFVESFFTFSLHMSQHMSSLRCPTPELAARRAIEATLSSYRCQPPGLGASKAILDAPSELESCC